VRQFPLKGKPFLFKFFPQKMQAFFENKFLEAGAEALQACEHFCTKTNKCIYIYLF
jgi:hypothetical protein